MHRNKKKGMISGVCAGLGEYFKCSPNIFRLIFVVSLFPTFLVSLALYIMLAFGLPDKSDK